MARVFGAIAIVIIVLGGVGFYLSKASLSGTFIGSGPTAAVMLQLVQGKDGFVSGSGTAMIVSPTGIIADMNLSVSGTTDGNAVTLLLTAANFPDSRLSGEIANDVMTLTGPIQYGMVDTFHLKRSDPAAFQRETDKLREQAADQLIRSAQVESDRKTAMRKKEESEKAIAQQTTMIATANQFSARLEAATIKAPTIIGALNDNSSKLQKIMSNMTDLLNRERALVGNNSASFARVHLAGQIHELVFATSHLEYGFRDPVKQITDSLAQITKEEDIDRTSCAQLEASMTNVGNQQALKVGCAKLIAAISAFDPFAKAVVAAVSNLEDTYRNEVSEQKAMESEAYSLE